MCNPVWNKGRRGVRVVDFLERCVLFLFAGNGKRLPMRRGGCSTYTRDIRQAKLKG
jgi:hypothetical protein